MHGVMPEMHFDARIIQLARRLPHLAAHQNHAINNLVILFKLNLHQFALAFLLAKLLLSVAVAAPGSSSTAFTQSVLGDVFAIAEQVDGRILVGGNLYYQNGRAWSPLIRCLPDGSPDSSFQVTANGTVQGIIVDPLGRIYICGPFSQVNGQTRQGVARMLADGTVDSTFNPQFVTPGMISCMALQANGCLLLGIRQQGVARISDEGVVDTSFAAVLDGTPRTLCPQSDGSIIVGGEFTSLNSGSASHLARLLSDGSTDPSWTCTANNIVYSVTQDAGGNLLVGGAFSMLGGSSRPRLGRLSSAGVVDAAFNPAPNNVVQSILPLANDQILVGGYFSSIGGATRNGVACLNPSGTADIMWANMGMASVTSLCLRQSGGLLTGRVRFVETTYGQFLPSLYAFDGGGFTSLLENDLHGIVNWTREGCAAHMLNVRLDASTDHGATWAPLGFMSKTGNGWQAVTGGLADGTLLRAQGYVPGSWGGSSGHWVHEYRVTGSPAPEVRVTVEGEGELTDAIGALSFSTAKQKKRLIIENMGSTSLVLGTPLLSSLAAFRLDLHSFQPLIAPDRSTTLDIEFDPPISGGSHSASLVFSANDPDEAVFDIALAGAAATAARSDVSSVVLKWAEPGAVTVSKALVKEGFHRDWLSYSMDVPANLMAATLTIYTDYLEDSLTKYSVNGNPAAASNVVALTLSRAAAQLLTITVIAADGVTTRTYEITLKRKAATPGDVNLDFRVPQPDGEVKIIAHQPDGNLALGGGFGRMGGLQRPGLAKINTQCALVTEFLPEFQGTVTSLLTAEDGSLLAGGCSSGQQRGFIRLFSTGERDLKLPSPIQNYLGDYSTIVKDGEGFLMTGHHSFLQSNSPVRSYLSRFYDDGSPDLTFKQSQTQHIWAMVPLENGRFLAGHTGGALVYDRFGTITQTLPLWGEVTCILPLPDGGFLVGGSIALSSGGSGQKVWRLKPDLTRDTAFTPSIYLQDQLTTLALQADGKILLGGCSILGGSADQVRTTKLVRLLPNGAQDLTFSAEVAAQSLPALVNSLALRRDGQLLVGGKFDSINGVSDANLTLLCNDPATESISVVSRNHVTWMRGGSSPEAMRTQFSLSRDGGNTWTDFGVGRRIIGGWEITGMNLPAVGRIRARAFISTGLYNGSTGILETIQDFSFEGEEITLLDDSAQILNAGSTLGFVETGTGLGARSSTTITVRNDGSLDLTGIVAKIAGAAQADFSIQSPPPESLAPGASAELTLTFSPKSLGSRQAELTLHSSDGDEPAITFVLQGNGVNSSSFTVTTGAAQQIKASSAVLQGTARAAGVSRQLFFDYGPTSSLGMTVAASPGIIAGTASMNVVAAITDLRPGFTYHYRLRGQSQLGKVIGSTRTFRTLATPAPAGIQVSGTTQAPPEGSQLTLQVTASEQDWWGVTGLPAWITTSLPTTAGSASLVLKVLPNTGSSTRQTKLIVGGVPVIITQAAVSAKPVISPGNRVYLAEASSIFAQQILVTDQPATLSVKGLPPGLALLADGWIRGHFDKEGEFKAIITARNGRGSTTVEWNFDVGRSDVLHSKLSGSYIALVPRDAALNRNLASRLDLTVTSTGGCSGKLTTGSTSVPFAGRLTLNMDGADFTVTLPVPGGPQILTCAFPYQQDSLRLRLQTLDGSTARTFSGAQTSPGITYSVNLALTHSQTGLDVPFGTGYLTCATTKNSKSMVLCIGRLGDGSVISFSSPLDANGHICLYHSYPRDGGTIAGMYPSDMEAKTATWLKRPSISPLPTDAYASGFGPVNLTIRGGALMSILPGGVRPGATATLNFSHSSLNVTESSFSVPFEIVNPSTKGLTNRAAFDAGTNPNFATLPTYNPVTGAFAGSFTLPGATASAKRKVTFQGLLVPSGGSFTGHGYFMLPTSSAKNAPQVSGRVSLTGN